MPEKLMRCWCGAPAHLIQTNLGWFAECKRHGHIHNAGVLGGSFQPTAREAAEEWNRLVNEKGMEAGSRE